MPVLIGTSGWQYRDWRGRFYPVEIPVRAWLESYAGSFATVESNNAFYRLPERHTFEDWADRTPDDFVMAVKVSRFLTHIKRLAEPEEPVERFLARARSLAADFRQRYPHHPLLASVETAVQSPPSSKR